MDNKKEIAELCISHFNSLPKKGKPNENEWTVLSCIVKEENAKFTVVSLGTGTKCIGISKMCPKGTILNDSHAEVMCRRAFLLYIYDQLHASTTIFDFNRDQKKFCLKPNIQFHFFTSHVPCGDAAIFPKQMPEDYGDVILQENSYEEVPAKKIKLDIFRTGAKCLSEDEKQDLKGEGTDYHVVGVVRTKPGRGPRTASVSCSDKLAKWCHLGIQGALLMVFLEKPIYLSSFIIPEITPFCKEALQRALFLRLGNLLDDPPFVRTSLNIFIVDVHFKYTKTNDKHPSASSIAWFLSKSGSNLEVAVNGKKQGVTAKHIFSEKARLAICKLNVYKLFMQKLTEFNIVVADDHQQLTYREAKNLVKQYQKNWDALRQEFGVWTSKDPHLLEFYAPLL